ncbi:MAG: hypothetical protein ACOYD9_00175 [Pyramidobacter sp.]|jgi:hypothetical protein
MRLLVTALSVAAVFVYGYALAGAGMYLIKGTHAEYILWGLPGGTFLAAAALFLYRKFPNSFFASDVTAAPKAPETEPTAEKPLPHDATRH